MIKNVGGRLTLRKCAASASVHVNGKPVEGTSSTPVNHDDRVFVGSNHVFRVVQPGAPASADRLDWLFAFTEKNQSEIASVKAMEAERRAALEEEVGVLASLVSHLSMLCLACPCTCALLHNCRLSFHGCVCVFTGLPLAHVLLYMPVHLRFAAQLLLVVSWMLLFRNVKLSNSCVTWRSAHGRSGLQRTRQRRRSKKRWRNASVS